MLEELAVGGVEREVLERGRCVVVGHTPAEVQTSVERLITSNQIEEVVS